MINFPCKCGHQFSLPDDQAGGLIQCPACRLLVDVPTLNDLKHLNADGTIEFEHPQALADEVTAADLHSVFTRKTVYSSGVEKDLRPGAEHFKAIGESIGLHEEVKPRAAPRYDPVTGELIRPLQFKDETPTPVISIGVLADPSEVTEDDDGEPLPVIAVPGRAQPRPKPLGYAAGDTAKQVTLGNLALELLMPANVTVMFFILPVYILAYYLSSALGGYAIGYLEMKRVWPFLLANFAMWLIISHVACVLEDTGPEAIDELPRPLRNFSPGEDLIAPMLRTVLAGVICFLPALLALRWLNLQNPAAPAVVGILGFAGVCFFPAVLLTAVTGTTLLNLSPDRVVAVIKICGTQYLASMLLWVLAAVPSVYYIAGGLLFPHRLEHAALMIVESPVLMLPLMMVAIYLLHFFCWHLGLLYRAHHDEFPWLAQRHIKDDRSSPRQIISG